MWVEVTPDFGQEQATGFRIVPIAWAAESEKELVAEIAVKAEDTESNTGNKKSFATTKVIIDKQVEDNLTTNQGEAGNDNDGIDHRQPVIEISASNNVNDFVYPEDIVRFEIKVKNISDATANDCYLIHRTYSEEGILIQTDRMFVGKIGRFKNGDISYGIKLRSKITENTKAVADIQIVGAAVDGTQIASNNCESDYQIKIREVASKGEGLVLAVSEPIALGEANQCKPQEVILPYVLLFIVSSIWLGRKTNDWLAKAKKMK